MLGIIALLVDVLVDDVELLWTDEELRVGSKVPVRAMLAYCRSSLSFASL